MTDPIDETQPQATSPGQTSPSQRSAGEPGGADAADPPTDSEPAAGSGEAPIGAPHPDAMPARASSSLRVDPDGPKATDWREPAWFPPRSKERGPNPAAILAGLALVIIGLYFFFDRTLGIAMPRIQWSTVWPVILIAIGAIVLVRSVRRRS